jgi:hypothetical protein
MVTAFKDMGYKAESHELSHFHDDYGLQAPEDDDDDETDEEDEDDEDDEGDDDDEDESGEE